MELSCKVHVLLVKKEKKNKKVDEHHRLSQNQYVRIDAAAKEQRLNCDDPVERSFVWIAVLERERERERERNGKEKGVVLSA